jgi:pentatricopeptide repeat protein
MTSLFEATNEGRSPRHQLWYLLLDRLADASGLDPSLEINVNMTIRRMLDTYPEAWPGHNLMRIGLRSAEVTKDAALMAQLIDRDLSRNREAMQQSRDAKSRRASSVPQVVFRKALNIALQNNDIQSMVSIFASFSEVAQEYPQNAVSECFGLMVRGYARTGRTEKSKELLMLMVEKGLETSDELFGDVLQSLVGGGKPDDAYDIFNQMNDPQGKLPVPGVSTYNAIIAAHVHARAWDKAISTFNQMREIGITPGAQSIQGFLLAQLGLHGSTVVGVVIEDLLKDKMSMDEGIFLFISRILLPGLGGGTTDEIRRKARDMGESQPRFRELCLKIVMTARTGEVRDKKAKARLVSESDDSKQLGESLSSHSWSEAVSSVLELKRAVEAAGTP